VLAVALVTSVAVWPGLHRGGGAANTLAAAAGDNGRDQTQAASRDFNRLAGTPTPSVAASATSAPPVGNTVTARPSPAVPAGCSGYGGNQLIACKLLPSFGFPISQMAPLVNLWNGESHWRTNAQNPSSGAYGIPQALPAGKLASAGSDWRTNPATQIRWGLGYIRSTYGTPAQAWALWQARSPHWY
jgi:hypothetical protein